MALTPDNPLIPVEKANVLENKLSLQEKSQNPDSSAKSSTPLLTATNPWPLNMNGYSDLLAACQSTYRNCKDNKGMNSEVSSQIAISMAGLACMNDLAPASDRAPSTWTIPKSNSLGLGTDGGFRSC